MAEKQATTVNGTHQVTRAILAEAAERVLGKEHSRDDVLPGTYPFDFQLTGHVGKREVTLAYAGNLTVDEDGIATPATPYKDLLAMVLGKVNDATRATCIAAIASGDVTADPAIVSALDLACKQWREREKSANPQRKRGNVKPVYSPADVVVIDEQPEAPAEVAAEAASEATVAKSAAAKRRKMG